MTINLGWRLGPRPQTRSLLALLAFVLGLATGPHRICEHDAAAYFDGDPERVDALAASVSTWTDKELTASSFATGTSRYDGEWLFGTYMMAAMGFGQIALGGGTAPSAVTRRRESIARMERCLDLMLAPPSRAFDREAWGIDALDSPAADRGSRVDRGHAAYLGYAGMALGVHRLLVTSSRFDAAQDAIVSALDRRFVASPIGLLETYPGEVYPVDNAAALGAIALHAQATGRSAPAGLKRGLAAIRSRAVQPGTGLLAQAVSATDASARDAGRGSGTALAAYFLAYSDRALSASLYQAVRCELFRTVLGFGAVLEHSPLCVDCNKRADIDSGPIVFGFSVSATGFAIGASRVHEDREVFTAAYATAHLFGAPFDEGASRSFASGGPLGDAILLAMLTAPRSSMLGNAAAVSS